MPTESLWEFATQVYDRPGVSALCLRLQDEHGLDVDVLLACLWWAQQGRSVDDVLEAMLRAAAPARAQVLQIRSVRRAVGRARADEPDWQSSYEHLLAAELAAERVELARIQAVLTDELHAAPPAEDRVNALARRNVHRYARAAGVNSGAAQLDALVERARDHRST